MFGTLSDGDYIEVLPAYGRDYKNKAEIEADLLGGKDFVLSTTRQYIDIRYIRDHKYRVIVRYGKLMKVTDMTKVIYKKTGK